MVYGIHTIILKKTKTNTETNKSKNKNIFFKKKIIQTKLK